MELVKIMNKSIFTNTLAIAEGIEHTHETVVKLLKNSRDLTQFSNLKSEKIFTKGRPAIVYWLDEEQATLLIMLMKNSPKVKLFKSKLAKEFYRQRNLLQNIATQKQNAEWLAQRESGKTMRLEETDMIKKFVNYATDQGSKNAQRYYANISKMETKALFFIEQYFPNMRDAMNLRQLNLIETADQAVTYALQEGMEEELPYKEIYQKAKARVEALAAIFPKTLIPLPQLTA